MAIKRRGFIKAAAAAAMVPNIITSKALGAADGTPAASNRVTMAIIGSGSRGNRDLNQFRRDKRVQLVAACDLAIAENGAKFATPGVKIGLFCSTPMVPLCRVIGRRRAMEMLLSGRFISASEAQRFGLVNKVVESEQLEEETAQSRDSLHLHLRLCGTLRAVPSRWPPPGAVPATLPRIRRRPPPAREIISSSSDFSLLRMVAKLQPNCSHCQ